MPLFNLPPDTRVVGSGNPPADMDALVDVLNHTVYQRQFYIDQYGADPTGATLSDSAWNSCYTDAVAAAASVGSATAGSVIRLGCGVYTFSVGTVAITDARVGLLGQGKASTLIRTTGSSGVLVSARGGSEPGTPGAAPVGCFTVYGWDAGSNVIGLRFGDRQYGTLYDVYANGFNNGGTAAGFQIAGTGNAVAEGVDAWGLVTKTCNVGVSFDGTLGGTSADYSRWKIHSIDSNTAMQFVNGAHSAGGQIQLTGTAGSANWANPVVLVIGNSGSDTSILQNCFLDIGVECTSGSTTVKDMVIQGTSNGGIGNGFGNLMFLNSSGTYTAGSITGARFSFNGTINGSPTLGLTGAADAHRADLTQSVNYLLDAVQAPASSGTILTATHGRFGVIPVNPAGAITGVILEKPSALNLPSSANGTSVQVTVVNRSAFTITFAASGTSFVADGTSDVIAATHAATYTYDTGTSLWYRT